MRTNFVIVLDLNSDKLEKNTAEKNIRELSAIFTTVAQQKPCAFQVFVIPQKDLPPAEEEEFRSMILANQWEIVSGDNIFGGLSSIQDSVIYIGNRKGILETIQSKADDFRRVYIKDGGVPLNTLLSRLGIGKKEQRKFTNQAKKAVSKNESKEEKEEKEENKQEEENESGNEDFYNSDCRYQYQCQEGSQSVLEAAREINKRHEDEERGKRRHQEPKPEEPCCCPFSFFKPRRKQHGDKQPLLQGQKGKPSYGDRSSPQAKAPYADHSPPNPERKYS